MPSLLPSISLSILHIPGRDTTDWGCMEPIQLEKQGDIPSAEPRDGVCPCANGQDQPVPTFHHGSHTRLEPSFGFWSSKLELHLNLEQGLVFSFLYRQGSFGETTKYEDYKLDQWTNSRESFSVFSGILYGKSRCQQSLHQISLKIFKLMCLEGFLGVLRTLFQWKLGALS